MVRLPNESPDSAPARSLIDAGDHLHRASELTQRNDPTH